VGNPYGSNLKTVVFEDLSVTSNGTSGSIGGQTRYNVRNARRLRLLEGGGNCVMDREPELPELLARSTSRILSDLQQLD